MLTAAALVVGLAGRRHEFATALSSAPLSVLAVAALVQIVALLARTEAWHLSIEAAGGSVARGILCCRVRSPICGGPAIRTRLHH